MLTMGEYMTLLQAVQEQNQFQQRKEELKEEVKSHKGGQSRGRLCRICSPSFSYITKCVC